jgi:two-component system sensor histidine kinase DesK
VRNWSAMVLRRGRSGEAAPAYVAVGRAARDGRDAVLAPGVPGADAIARLDAGRSLHADYPVVDDEGIDGAWRWRGGWQRWVFPSVWMIYLLQTVHGLGVYSPGGWFLVGCAILVVYAYFYLRGLPFSSGPTHAWQSVGVMLVLTGLETTLAHQDALIMCVFIAVLAMSTGSRSGPVFVVVLTVISVALPAMIPAWHASADWDMLVTLPMVAIAMFGFFTVIRSARELAAARAEVVRLAAENERTRIARDLHDLLGHSLTTITIKAALAKRLADRDPARAAQEIGEVEALGRSSLADVRAVVAGYREVSLAGELASARYVLRSSDIVAQFPVAIDAVPVEYHELFGWALREGITNVVRHARATTCTVTLGATWLQIDDDGRIPPSGPTRARSAGTGMIGLAERAAAFGGTVESAPGPSGWTLRVDVPPVAASGATTPKPGERAATR